MSEKRTSPLPFDPSTVDLDALLKRLNLANTRRMWRTLIERAENDGWSCRDFLAVLVSEEVSHRQQTRLQRAVHQARFPFLKTIDDFDFSLQTTLRRQLLGSYLGPELVSEDRNLILLGKSGRGKTHLVIVIAYKAIQNGFTTFFTTTAALIEDLSVATTRGKLREALVLYLQPHLLVIDEVGYLSVGPDAANVLFHLVNERHLRRRPLTARRTELVISGLTALGMPAMMQPEFPENSGQNFRNLQEVSMKKYVSFSLTAPIVVGVGISSSAISVRAADNARPNILMIMTDDVGYWNVGAYNHGMMGVPTPNIDRLAREGILFTDHYAQPTSTPGRAAFITGQLPIRTGLTTVGMPGSPIGIDFRDPTLAEVLKQQGYRSGQFGKNHLGDRNEHLPTVHGFDEFYGNLYHLNTEEEPELATWPKDPGFNQRYRPRGVLDCVATDVDDATVDPRFGKVGKQKIRDTGPLTSKRMETIDDEFLDRTVKFMGRAVKDGKPFFVWYNPTRMHIYTHLRPERRNLATPYTSEFDIYGSGIMELDMQVGQLIKKLEELGVADDTIVLFTADNGAMVTWWPDAGTTPFRSEKATTWEGGVRVPMLVRWPAKIKEGKVSNGIQDNTDLFTTLASAAGIPNVADQLKKSHKVFIDGVDNLAHWTGNAPSARNFELYYNESQLTAVRIGNWKSHMMIREGFFDYNKPSALIFNLRMDPFEQHDGWKSEEIAMRLGIAWGGQITDVLGTHFMSLQEFPPRQKGGTLKPGGQN